MDRIKKGKFVYRNEDCMQKMHAFYDKTLAALCVPYEEENFDTSFGKTHCLLVCKQTKEFLFSDAEFS